MRVRNRQARHGRIGEVIDFRFNLANEAVFRVIWYGYPGSHEIPAAELEVVK